MLQHARTQSYLLAVVAVAVVVFFAPIETMCVPFFQHSRSCIETVFSHHSIFQSILPTLKHIKINQFDFPMKIHEKMLRLQIVF